MHNVKKRRALYLLRTFRTLLSWCPPAPCRGVMGLRRSIALEASVRPAPTRTTTPDRFSLSQCTTNASSRNPPQHTPRYYQRHNLRPR